MCLSVSLSVIIIYLTEGQKLYIHAKQMSRVYTCVYTVLQLHFTHPDKVIQTVNYFVSSALYTSYTTLPVDMQV